MKLSAPCPVCNSSKWCGRACVSQPVGTTATGVVHSNAPKDEWARRVAGDVVAHAAPGPRVIHEVVTKAIDAVAEQKAARRRSKETGVLVGVRLQPDLLAKLDARCDAQGIGRPEAIRAILEEKL